jgi:acyl-coenzyme A thioesterase PaaI-like protein
MAMSDDVMGAVRQEPPEGYVILNWTRGFGRQVGPLYYKDEASEGGSRRTMGLYIEEHHTNGMLNAHGGLLMTLADMAWGNVVSVQRSAFWVTVRLICDFLSGAQVGDWVEAGGALISDEDDLFVVQGRVWCGDRPLMSGTGLFKAVTPREPRPGERAYVTKGA